MEFEASATTAGGTTTKKKQNKNKNKNKNKKKKGNNNDQKETNDELEESQTVTIADEFAAFLFLLDMEEEEEEEEEEDESEDNNSKSSSSWTSTKEQETLMSASYLSALTTQGQGQSLLETEFLLQFRTHVAWKKYLSRVEMRSLKDRVFLLMAKEKEAESNGEGEDTQSQHEQILYGHFLYEELCLQHRYLTTPQVTDTPNDTAFKVTMVPVVCGLIRNCNESRDTICLDVKDDEEESTALFNARMAPPGSCLASVLRPLYRHLLHLHSQRESEGDKKGESDGGSLSQQLQDLCCSSTSGSGSDIDSANSRTISSPMFFEGPPEWHYNLDFFMKRVQYSKPSPERMGFVKHALRTAQALRVVQEQKKFYNLAYRNAHYHTHVPADVAAGDSSNSSGGESYPTLSLSFSTHMMLHRAAQAVVSLKPSSTLPPDCDSDSMTLSAFKRLVKVQLPRLLVTPCSHCATPCTGECVCGASYCSARCLEAEMCNGCALGCAEELKYLTPVAWGRAPLALA